MAINNRSMEGGLVLPFRCICDADVAPTVYCASVPALIAISLRFSLNDILFENMSCVGGGTLIV